MDIRVFGPVLTVTILIGFGVRAAMACPQESSQADNVSSRDLDPVVIKATTEIHRSIFGQQVIDCGSVEQGRNIKVELTVINRMDDDFAFDVAVPNCIRTRFKASANVIAPGGSIVMEFDFQSSIDTSAREQRSSVKLLRGTKELGFLVPVCRIQYGLALERGQHSLLLGGAMSEYRIPFAYTPPISIDQLNAVETSGFDNTDVAFEVKPLADGFGYIAALTKDVGGQVGFDSGVVRLVHHPTGRFAETTLAVSRKLPIEMAPVRLYFYKLESSPSSDLYVATALVRFNLFEEVQGESRTKFKASEEARRQSNSDRLADRSLDREGSKKPASEIDDAKNQRRQSEREKIHVRGEFNEFGEPLIEANQIGKTVLRVRIFAKQTVLADNQSIIWTFTRNDQNYELVSPFSVEN